MCVFVNGYERSVGLLFMVFAVAMWLSFAFSAEAWPGRIVAGVGALACAGFAWRCRRRPRLDLTPEVVLVRSVLWTTKIRVEEIEAWGVAQGVIGAFTRECLCVKRFGSEFRSLGQRGMYVRRSGPQFEELQRLVEVRPVRGRPFRGLPGGS